jgi:hypothetical protein
MRQILNMGSPYHSVILGKSTVEPSEASEDCTRASRSVASLHISFLFCTLTVCGFLIACERTTHWFLVPVLFCGVLIGIDAVDWFRGRLDIFDPAGIIGLLGLHFFFLAPLLHVTLDSWMKYIEPPPDWRDWLGGMAVVNAIGLILYRSAKRRAAAWEHHTTKQTYWRLSRKRLLWIAGCGLVFSGALQIWVYVQHGGIVGYIEEFTRLLETPDSPGFENTGFIFTLSESFPILAMIYFAVCTDRSWIARSWLIIALVLLGMFTLQLLFGGLRGSRSNTIWALFWAAGIIHFWMRPLTRKFVFVGIVFMIVFMYIYGFYKGLGQNAWTALQEGASTSELSVKSRLSFDTLLLGDLGRADVQAFLLYRLSMPDRDYQYAWGRTYLGSIALLIPRPLWPNRPPTKIKEGTEAQFGTGSWDERRWSSALVYGLAGETMLNFGLIPVPLTYLIFGVIVGRLQHILVALHNRDTRLLLYPFIVNICFSLLTSDSDNILFSFIKGGLVPAFVVWLGSSILVYSKAAQSSNRSMR